MWALLGLLLLAGISASGGQLECEVCSAQGSLCNGSKVRCLKTQDRCMTNLTTITLGTITNATIVKRCSSKADCIKAQKEILEAAVVSPIRKHYSIRCTGGHTLNHTWTSGSVRRASSGLQELLVLALLLLAPIWY